MTIATLLIAFIAIPFSAGQDAPVMLDFTATWCGPCRQMKDGVEALAEKGYPIKPVDIDKYPELAERYKVTGVPTFIVIEPGTGRELGRTSGYQPTTELAAFYKQASERVVSRKVTEAAENGAELQEDPAPAPAAEDLLDTEAVDAPEAKKAEPPAAGFKNPNPWETVVRIKIHGSNRMVNFGSGTIIYSSPTESIVLTCAHIFKLDRGPQAPPSKFPKKITLDLFDGNLTGNGPSRVHYANESFEGQAIDYDFGRDVGLIRFKPGRRLPYARVVPEHWSPKVRMGMTTVGCSEGQDASAWNTVILNPSFRGMVTGEGNYEAIECQQAPIRGRSGGGLLTNDGYLAGVCDFAEVNDNRGLYASPKSIYTILDRNKMMAFYAPVQSPPAGLIAQAEPRRRPAKVESRMDLAARARGQSDDHDESNDLTLPDPEMFRIKTPKIAAVTRRQEVAGTSRRDSWHPIPSTTTTDVERSSSTDPDRFATDEPAAAEVAEQTEADVPKSAERRKPVYSTGGWRPVSEVSATPNSESQRIPAAS